MFVHIFNFEFCDDVPILYRKEHRHIHRPGLIYMHGSDDVVDGSCMVDGPGTQSIHI